LLFGLNFLRDDSDDAFMKSPKIVDRHRLPAFDLFVRGTRHDGQVSLVDFDDRAPLRGLPAF
jgi:hypothetical protein